MNDSIAYNRSLLNKKMTVKKLRETYREEVLNRPLHYDRLNPEVLKDRIKKKLKRNRMQEIVSRILAAGLLILSIAGITWIIMFLTAFMTVAVQIPQDIPHQSEPVDFTSPLNILLYIVLPVIMVVYYYLWRKNQRKK